MPLNPTLRLFIYLLRFSFFPPRVHTEQTCLDRNCAEGAPHD